MKKSEIAELMKKCRQVPEDFQQALDETKTFLYEKTQFWKLDRITKAIDLSNPTVILDLCERLLGMQEALIAVHGYIEMESVDAKSPYLKGYSCMRLAACTETTENALEKFGVKDE